MHLKKIFSICICLLIMVSNVSQFTVTATTLSDNSKTVSVDEVVNNMSATSLAAFEVTTGKKLFSKNEDEVKSISSLAKLMTLLLTIEAIDSGDLSMNELLLVSEYANSMPAPQIWLDKGEKIKTEDVVKSITIGNANDACVVLAERLGGTEKKFVEKMNERAQNLEMDNTHFVDCTGINDSTVSTVSDMAKLCFELLKYKNLKPYLTTWMDTVRGGKAELVNQNILVRNYKGISGMKACGSEISGHCICASAERNNLSVCVVMIGSQNNEKSNADAKKLLDMCFDSYEIYVPEIPVEFVENMNIANGEKSDVEVEIKNKNNVVIPRGSYHNIEMKFDRKNNVSAPIDKGTSVGKLQYKLDGREIAEIEIVVKYSVKKMNMCIAVKKLMYNLLNL